MARRKRNRNKKKQAETQYFAPDGTPLVPINSLDRHVGWSDQDSYDDDDSKPERGTEILDEPMIDNGSIPGISRTDFVDAGFTCTECDWNTKKKSLSGVQALRGHSKRHVRDRRATRNSQLLNATVLIVGLLIGATPDIARGLLSTIWPSTYQLNIPIPVDIFSKSIAVISVILALVVLVVSDEFVATGRRRWSRAYRCIERIWITYVMLIGLVMWTDIGQSMQIYWLISALMPWVASVFVRVSVAKTRIKVRRREFKPRSQVKLLRSKKYWTDSKIRSYTSRLKQGIQDGRIKLPELTRRQVNYYRRLGLGGVRRNPTLEAKRLSKERYVMRVKARESAAKERKQQRQRVSNSQRTKRSHRPDQNSPVSKREPA